MDIPYLVKVREDGMLNVETQNLGEILKNFPNNFLILSIIGDRQSGKTNFVNNILKFLDPNMKTHGFPTTNVNLEGHSEQHGVRFWPNSFKLQHGVQDLKLILLDIDCRNEEGNSKFLEIYSKLEIFCLALSSLTIYLDKNEPDSTEAEYFIKSTQNHLPHIYKSKLLTRKIIYLQNIWPNLHQKQSKVSPKLVNVSTHLNMLMGIQNKIYQIAENFSFIDPLNHKDKFPTQNSLHSLISFVLEQAKYCQSIGKKSLISLIIDLTLPSPSLNSEIISKFPQKSSINDEFGLLKGEIMVHPPPQVPKKPGKMNKIAIGIHFETEFIRCGIYENSKFQMVPTLQGDLVLRNFVTILETEGVRQYLVGEEARNTYLKNQEDFKLQFYGNGSPVAVAKHILKFPRLKIIISFLFWEISKMIQNMTGYSVGLGVIVLPISSNFLFRNIVKSACQIAGFKYFHIITEPMAAAYTFVKKHGDQPRPLMIFSHEKNQFDCTILDVKLNCGKIYATSGSYLLNSNQNKSLSIDVVSEQNLEIIKDFLINSQKGGQFYGILVGDTEPNYLTTFKKNMKKHWPLVNFGKEINTTEGIVQGGSILAEKILNEDLNLENFIDVNPFDIKISDSNGEIIFDLKRNTELPVEQLVHLNNNYGGIFKFQDSKGSLRDFNIEAHVSDLWLKVETCGLSMTKLKNGENVGLVEEIYFLEEKTIQDFKLKFNNYLNIQ